MHDTLVHQVGVRQMSRARQMSASRSAARVLARELSARTAVEHMCRAVELTLQCFPIDHADRPGARRQRKSTARRACACRNAARGQRGPAAVHDQARDAEEL
jgi:hypothetical protein